MKGPVLPKWWFRPYIIWITVSNYDVNRLDGHNMYKHIEFAPLMENSCQPGDAKVNVFCWDACFWTIEELSSPSLGHSCSKNIYPVGQGPGLSWFGRPQRKFGEP